MEFKSFGDHAEHLLRKAEALKANNVVLQRAVTAVHTVKVKRIFTDGKNVEGGKIGAYNRTNPLYINPKSSPVSVAPKGKDGQSKFKNGNQKKTAYFPSYKAYRAAIGRPNSFVILFLSGDLRSDFAKPPQKVGPNRFREGVTRKINGDKIDGAHAKYGNVFDGLTDTEHELLMEVNQKELVKYLST